MTSAHRPSERQLLEARRILTRSDRVLARLDPETPPLEWPAKQPGFPGLARLIVEQQLSAAASRTIWQRLAPDGFVTPDAITGLGEVELHARGLARPKARSLVKLASLFAGADPLHGLEMLDDESAAERLIELPGLGPWSAASYLLWTLGRLDVFPAGDAALGRAIADAYRCPVADHPAIVDHWRPYRGVGALFVATWSRARSSLLPPPNPRQSKETAHV